MQARNVWQVSAGPWDRSYVDVFLDYGVALIGPGDPGPWNAERSDEYFEGSFVRRFASDLGSGDVILLRMALSTIRAIGLVASGYKYYPQFDDVNGWDLQHGRRVRWCPLPEPYDFKRSVFGANPPRLSRLHSEDVCEYAARFVQSAPTEWQTRELPRLPEEEPLFGAPPSELREIVAQVHDLVGLYGTDAFGERPSEDELVAHYVIPFLRALGWPAEKIAVKWRHIDVCVFATLPRVPEDCLYLIEAKRLGTGVEGALGQAKRYVSTLEVSRDVVVTDGVRYRMYDAQNGFAPVAYANLAHLKKSASHLIARMRRT